MRSVTLDWLAQKYNLFVVTAESQAVTKKKMKIIIKKKKTIVERDPQIQSYLTNWCYEGN